MALSASAHAIPITYTESVVGTGVFDSSSFTNQLITITAVGDTSTLSPFGPVTSTVAVTATVTVAGLGTKAFDTSGMFAFHYPVSPAVGFIANAATSPDGVVVQYADIIDTLNPVLASYDLISPVTVSGAFSGNPGFSFGLSDGGSFAIYQATDPSTFTASTSSVPPTVPEPNSILLLGTGLLGVVGILRNRWLS